MAKRGKRSLEETTLQTAENYQHPTATAALRPDVGTQAQFRKRKLPRTYRYDSSLSPSLEWDSQNAAREASEALLQGILEAGTLEEAKAVAEKLRGLSKPFLNWAGKAERLSFDVPTLPLFIHERLSTKAILETLKGHTRDRNLSMLDLFGDPQRPIYEQVLRAYEHRDNWTNRLILGDSLVVMNSLLSYEGLGGQVQMIYMDPPYGVKFGSNFQPFVRKRDVKHNDGTDMTREPEMVQAYRDTWELGLHSYLTYLRDRLLLCRELFTPSGSIFVQISDENLHHVREVMDEVFGGENACGIISFAKTTGQTHRLLASVSDYLLWYARDREAVRCNRLFEERPPFDDPYERYVCVETEEGEIIDLSLAQKLGQAPIPPGRILKLDNLTSQTGSESSRFPIEFEGAMFLPSGSRGWSTSRAGIEQLRQKGLLRVQGTTLWWKNYRDNFPFRPLRNNWTDVKSNAFGNARLYVVQTNVETIKRCLLMTTDPGDLVMDPTCGSGTTAYVAEQWGRRWISIDTSRVPLALARQRLLTATFPWYELKDLARGPAGGFVYKRRQNSKGEEVGGIVPHITLKSIANNEPPDEEIMVDRPEVEKGITRVTGPFCVEATIPKPVEWGSGGDEGPTTGETAEVYGSFVDRMLEVLRKSPVLQVGGGKSITLSNVRLPAKTLSLSAEALVGNNGNAQPVAIVFGPENGAVSEKLVFEAAREAHAKSYAHLYVIGFAIQPNARTLIEACEAAVGIPATYVQATPDLTMGDLLKTMRSSQIFSVCGLPEVKLHRCKPEKAGGPPRYQVELLGLDVFDPAIMATEHRQGNNVPAWFLDTDYNGLCFHVCQAFFPRTSAWDALKRALKGVYEDSVWEHLAGTTSAPFEAGEHGQVAIKVTDDRGNELLVVKLLREGRKAPSADAVAEEAV